MAVSDKFNFLLVVVFEFCRHRENLQADVAVYKFSMLSSSTSSNDQFSFDTDYTGSPIHEIIRFSQKHVINYGARMSTRFFRPARQIHSSQSSETL